MREPADLASQSNDDEAAKAAQEAAEAEDEANSPELTLDPLIEAARPDVQGNELEQATSVEEKETTPEASDVDVTDTENPSGTTLSCLTQLPDTVV